MVRIPLRPVLLVLGSAASLCARAAEAPGEHPQQPARTSISKTAVPPEVLSALERGANDATLEDFQVLERGSGTRYSAVFVTSDGRRQVVVSYADGTLLGISDAPADRDPPPPHDAPSAP